MNASKIIAVNFTYACDGGLYVRRADGSQEWLSASQLVDSLGAKETSRLWLIAHANGMTGMWYNAENGRNCYVNGQLVNA